MVTRWLREKGADARRERQGVALGMAAVAVAALDITCRLTATGRPYYVALAPIGWYSNTPYEDLQTTFQQDINDTLRTLTRPAARKD